MASSRLITALYGVAAAILIALIAVVWSRPAVGIANLAQSAPAAAASVRSSPCDLIIGPARAYCDPATGRAASPGSTWRAMSSQAVVLVPATLAVGAAVGLVMVAGGRRR